MAQAKTEVSFTGDRITLPMLLELLGKGVGMKVELVSVPEMVVPPAKTGKMTVKEGLVRLARAYDLTYEVVRTDELIVHGGRKTG